jgi:hypothetical protein
VEAIILGTEYPVLSTEYSALFERDPHLLGSASSRLDFGVAELTRAQIFGILANRELSDRRK